MQTDPGRLLVKIFKQTGEAYLVRHSKLAALKVLSKGLIRFGVSRENRKWLFNALKTFGRHLKAIGPGWVVEMGKQIGAYLALATSHINPTGIVRVYAEAPTPPPATGTGQITAVCPSSDAYIDGSDPETSVPFERCSSDWSDSGIEQPDGIVCNGHVDDALDNTLAFRFLRDGSVVFQATPRTIDDVLGSSGDWFQRWTPGGGAVAPGAYTCQLQLNGQVVAEQAFSVY